MKLLVGDPLRDGIDMSSSQSRTSGIPAGSAMVADLMNYGVAWVSQNSFATRLSSHKAGAARWKLSLSVGGPCRTSGVAFPQTGP